MKFLLPALISSVVLSAGAVASENSGHRIGLGFSKTDINGPGLDGSWGDGIKLEYGYDINRVFGINVSFSKHKDSGLGYSVDGTTFKMDTDIGYKFDLEGFAVKPYLALGFASLEEDIKFVGMEGVDSSSTIFSGLGVRGDIGQHFYTDLRLDLPMFDDYEYDQVSLTFGYRF